MKKKPGVEFEKITGIEFEKIKLICPDCGTELKTDICDKCGCEISLEEFYIDIQPGEILE